MSRLVAGLMSGTSLDGLDASLVKINGFGADTKVDRIKSISLPYTDALKQELLDVMNVEKSNVEKICSLNVALSYQFAKAVKKVCAEADIDLEDLDLIGSHGQTVYHIPKETDSLVRSTLQIGDPSIIAYETNTMVVSNFRMMDIAAGGEGAPLIPYIDWLLYRNQYKGRILQNIGGIGNCTVIEKNASLETIYAFDTGPGNMIIDALCRRLFNVPYDERGRIAGRGVVHKEIVESWMTYDFFSKQPPKSTGRETFGEAFTSQIIKDYKDLPYEDLVATATYFTAYSIADAYEKFVFPKTEIADVIISGGGGNNPTLITMIQNLLPSKNVYTSEQLGITADEKEAVGFAVLANETIHQQKANVPNATGAKEPVILGQITLPPYGDNTYYLLEEVQKVQ
ncbi:anhydro-N-acetylmuramic acid kinase AnmK [Oceanobacillus jeddahense]|uniref:Anhydro-N-acetylmuramic acid kinase n=1 Tax=Oceanobacillus jeddahense TaxID=1462527 RepID=A0ABY5K0B3_9BACI|nr:anhydro-N-acetylmuramic acid kinase AnmK [Oceanobacillus jeddahense]UUI05464.1 anhydro-N-acetylmuramic acid kinase AnmK [Oceanobacillus jeddahense]